MTPPLSGGQLTLPVCCLPGCPNPVGQTGDACDGCLRDFGSMLRTTPDGEPMDQAAIDERDTYVRDMYRQQRETSR